MTYPFTILNVSGPYREMSWTVKESIFRRSAQIYA